MYSNLMFFNYSQATNSSNDQFVFYSKINKSYDEIFQNRKYISNKTNEIIKTNPSINNSNDDYNFIYLCTNKVIHDKLLLTNSEYKIDAPKIIALINNYIAINKLNYKLNDYKFLYNYLSGCNIISTYLYLNHKLYDFVYKIGELINPSIIYVD